MRSSFYKKKNYLHELLIPALPMQLIIPSKLLNKI